jgi:fatty acid synthase subunit alpha
MHGVAVKQDLPPFEASKETAQAFQLRHRNKVSIEAVEDSD